METGDVAGGKVEVKKAVKDSERQIWESRMQGKSVLGLHREWKTKIAGESFFLTIQEGAHFCLRHGMGR